jgi:ATP-dependent Lhr-like helicase
VSPETVFDRLHPALQHHIVNSLGWRSLRPLQEAAIDPILAGDSALLLAPTAGGKTEAAMFPLLSRMQQEDWQGLGVLYVCPIKALLNNLEPRLREYGAFVGRRVALWHGDVGQAARLRIMTSPPDILLTTPESIEVMLVSRRSDPRTLFRHLQAVVIDELHAFAGDDRGWHLLAVLERVAKLAGREIQRLGLSATIGNPTELIEWLAPSSSRPRHVIAPEAEVTGEAEVGLDYVGSLENAARVVAQLHRGEKRLVFCDSRARVEELAAGLRGLGVDTYVSHSSLSLDERRRAESAFAQGSNCVIVATSTLELGIDVGDLDRIIQIDAPATVASFLQRLGRTGRRAGSSRNCLFLTTSEDGFLRAAGLLRLWSEGYVEPVVPPPEPFHIFAQQIMALSLQEGRIGRLTWREWLAGMPAFAAMAEDHLDEILAFMLACGILYEEEGMLSMGVEGERAFGRRHFMELMSVFTSDPLFEVRHGRQELGRVHPLSFATRKDEMPTVLLAGRAWLVSHVDWRDRVAYVEPSQDRGRSQWLGSGQALRFELCRAVRRALATGEIGAELTSRGRAAMEAARDKASWVDDESTAIVRSSDGAARWWTFAGLRANAALTELLGSLAKPGARAQNLCVQLCDGAQLTDVEERLRSIDAAQAEACVPLSDDALEGLKFAECLPEATARSVLEARLADPASVRACLEEKVRFVSISDETPV